MKHYDYLEPRPTWHRKSILWGGFLMVFFALQGIIELTLTIPLLIVGNLIILAYSYLEMNKELMLLTILMGIAQLTRIL
tara:strand:+ start:341 stop:577 length:237 start_codon:yes stop_codon:yes gene_type:complete